MTEDNHNNLIPITIVNWNGLHDTIECIESLFQLKEVDYKIYVWDNNSSNDEANFLIKKYKSFDNIIIIESNENIGFTKASNKLFNIVLKDYPNLDYIATLNNDTIVHPLWLSRLKLGAKPNAGIVSSRMLQYFNRNRIDNLGHKLLSSGEIVPIKHGFDSTCNGLTENIGACAGAALYSVEMLKEIGHFDTFFNTGYEDAEIGLRAYMAGYSLLHADDAIVYHKLGSSISKVFNIEYAIKQQINIIYTIYKCYPYIILFISIPLLTIRNLVIVLLAFLFGKFEISKAICISQYRFYTNFTRRSTSEKKNSTRTIKANSRLLRKINSVFLFDIKRIYRIVIMNRQSAIDSYGGNT